MSQFMPEHTSVLDRVPASLSVILPIADKTVIGLASPEETGKRTGGSELLHTRTRGAAALASFAGREISRVHPGWDIRDKNTPNTAE